MGGGLKFWFRGGPKPSKLYIIISIKIDGICNKFRFRVGPKPQKLENIYIFSYFIIIMHNKIEIMRKYKYFPVLGVFDWKQITMLSMWKLWKILEIQVFPPVQKSVRKMVISSCFEDFGPPWNQNFKPPPNRLWPDTKSTSLY